jgi:hypothetical protein
LRSQLWVGFEDAEWRRQRASVTLRCTSSGSDNCEHKRFCTNAWLRVVKEVVKFL